MAFGRRALSHVAVALLGAAPPAAALAGDFARTLALAPGDRLVLRLDRGEVRLRPGPAATGEATVAATWRGFGAAGVRFEVARRGPEVVVRGHLEDWVGWLRGGPDVEVQALVPAGVPVRVETAGGVDAAGLRSPLVVRASGPVQVADGIGPVEIHAEESAVRVAGVRGGLRVRARNGRVEVRDVRGPVEVESGGGIHVFGASGPVRAVARRGAVQLDRVAGAVSVRTDDGPVWTRLVAAPQGTIEAQGGGIHVALPDRASGVIDARSAGGRVDVAPALHLAGERDARSARGVLGDGGPVLRLRALGGPIMIR